MASKKKKQIEPLFICDWDVTGGHGDELAPFVALSLTVQVPDGLDEAKNLKLREVETWFAFTARDARDIGVQLLTTAADTSAVRHLMGFLEKSGIEKAGRRRFQSEWNEYNRQVERKVQKAKNSKSQRALNRKDALADKGISLTIIDESEIDDE